MVGSESELKRFSQACENNKQPIAEQLMIYFASINSVLEIGSGTGQHAAYFATAMPHLLWQPTDVKANHNSIRAWSQQENASNVKPPIPFFIGKDTWPHGVYEGVFSANTAHIMQPDEVQLMMQVIADNLPMGGVFCQYGPFKVDGQCTSESNALFDQSLLQRGCGGIRDIQELLEWANGLTLHQVVPMPANNFLLVWHKTNRVVV